MKYLAHYPESLQNQAKALLDKGDSKHYFYAKYPTPHTIRNDKALFQFTMEMKKSMRKSAPLTKAIYDGKVSDLHNALGLHTYAKRLQGTKIKTKNEIRIATLFKSLPEAFLRMIIAHELAHFKHKDHSKSFYDLCTYLEPSYHQYEFDLRFYLTHLEHYGALWKST